MFKKIKQILKALFIIEEKDIVTSTLLTEDNTLTNQKHITYNAPTLYPILLSPKPWRDPNQPLLTTGPPLKKLIYKEEIQCLHEK